MHSSLKGLNLGTRDALLALVAFSASVLPFARELSDARRFVFCGPASHAIEPVALGDEAYAIAAKLVLTAAILVLAAFVARCSASGNALATLAALPLVRSSLLIGALTAAGLTAFDLCTAFHGASTDVAGSCHCWLTGLLAAAGALFTIGSASVARALRDAVRDLHNALESIFVWLERTLVRSCPWNRLRRDQPLIVELVFATPFGGRAPPFA
jgi:hypothetical protein